MQNEGIQNQLTSGYTPQQNGVFERRNRTIVEMFRTMTNEKRLPKYFWVEAVHTTIHILNRCPTKSLKDKTPVEAWSGIKPSVSHFKNFGCICYAHVPAEKITKLDEKSQRKCIFLGYSDMTKGYKFFDVKTNKLVVSRDVMFDEKKYGIGRIKRYRILLSYLQIKKRMRKMKMSLKGEKSQIQIMKNRLQEEQKC